MILYYSILIEATPKAITIQVTSDICTTLTKSNFQVGAQKPSPYISAGHQCGKQHHHIALDYTAIHLKQRSLEVTVL